MHAYAMTICWGSACCQSQRGLDLGKRGPSSQAECWKTNCFTQSSQPDMPDSRLAWTNVHLHTTLSAGQIGGYKSAKNDAQPNSYATRDWGTGKACNGLLRAELCRAEPCKPGRAGSLALLSRAELCQPAELHSSQSSAPERSPAGLAERCRRLS